MSNDVSTYACHLLQPTFIEKVARSMEVSHLAPHLQTTECNDLIKKLEQCHKEHSFGKFLGFCNSSYTEVTKCLKEERSKRRQLNYEKSLQTKAKLKLLSEEERKQNE